MKRVVISKRILDRLIRAKLVQLDDDCLEVQALPVVVKHAPNGGCNWTVPGWTGNVRAVDYCQQRMRTYLEFLQGQFDVTDT